jgi:hypothetical protein
MTSAFTLTPPLAHRTLTLFHPSLWQPSLRGLVVRFEQFETMEIIEVEVAVFGEMMSTSSKSRIPRKI